MYWYGSVDTKTSIDPVDVYNRLSTFNTDMSTYTPCNWHDVVDLGLVKDRSGYLSAIRSATMYIAEQKLISTLNEKDIELIQMVKTLDELDTVINILTERLVDWYISVTPSYSRKYQHISNSKLVSIIKKTGITSMNGVAKQILSLSETRTRLMKEVSNKANTVIPNMSALVGGLVAARLVCRAGSLKAIARLPGSSIQVLGSSGAIFSHIRMGSPSPKHGILYQHRRVHGAGRKVRGSVSRALASKLAIAARIDYYRGDLDPVFIEHSNCRIDNIMNGDTK